MAGVRQFDQTDVVDALVHIFWRLAYRAARLSDLAGGTEVQRGSLYNTYGDKERMLIIALDCYPERQREPIVESLARQHIADTVEGFLEAHLVHMANATNPIGCLICQTALEYGANASAMADAVKRNSRRTENTLADRFGSAERGGELASSTDPRDPARDFLGVSLGMAFLHRAYGNLDAIHAMAATPMAVLR